MNGATAAIAGSITAPAARRRGLCYLRWLRQVHMYVGLWGAGLGLMFGATGLLMTHRAILKIPVETAVQQTAQWPLPDPSRQRFDRPQAMARWLQGELRFDALQTRIKSEPPRTVIWGDRELTQPALWTFHFQSPHKSVSAEYQLGNRFVTVETQDATPLGTLMRLHMSTGVNAFWVLLADTIALGLITQSLTGLLLWSRLRPRRITGAGVGLAGLLAATWFLWASS